MAKIIAKTLAFLAFCLALAYAQTSTINVSETSPPASGTGWTYSDGIYTILDGANVTITGNNGESGRSIVIAENATANITLNGVSIVSDSSPIYLSSNANLTITLVDNSMVTAAEYGSGIQASSGTKLTIKGAGSLTATGGYGAAGIGGGRGYDGGEITIDGGTVIATGGSDAAGIGGGNGSSEGGNGGKITINGGTVIATAGSYDGADIGGGYKGSGGEITISGGIVIATGVVQGMGNGIGSGRGAASGMDTFTMDGNAMVFSLNQVSDEDESRKTGGILVVDKTTNWYGGNEFILAQNIAIPASYALLIDEGKTLTVPSGVTLTNNGIVVNFGTINYGGEYGTWAGNPPYMNSFPSIELSDEFPIILPGSGLHYGANVYSISDGANVTITGSNGERGSRIAIAANATVNITLDGATITSMNIPAIELGNNANLTITLVDNNVLWAMGGGGASTNCAGIRVPSSATLTVKGEGSLKVTGGTNCAGIGGGNGWGGYSALAEPGTIIINGGIITAIGGNNGEGIGRGGITDRIGGTVIINGGIVNAKGSSASDIGSASTTIAGGSIFAANNTISGFEEGSELYPVKVTVLDASGNKVNGAIVASGSYTAVTGKNYADADFSEFDDGVAWLWLPEGNATITASYGDEENSGIINVSSSEDNELEIAEENTPIAKTLLAASSIRAYMAGSSIVLESLPKNASVKVYSLNGKQVYSGNSGNSQILKIQVQTKGVYLVSINGKTLKVAK